MIDKATGEIRIRDMLIGPRFTKREFLASTLHSETVHEDHYGYSRYALRSQKLDTDFLAVALYFRQDGRLEFISLSILDDEQIPSWQDWSREKQEQRKVIHDQWLRRHLGPPPYRYRWGAVLSDYDPRSATSTITIRYLIPTEE